MLLETKVDGEHCRDGVSCKPSSDMDSCAVYDRSDCSRDEQLHNNGLLTSESRAAERLSQGFHQCECMEARDPGANLGVASSPGQDLDECKKCKPEDPLLSSQMQTDHSTQRETKEFGETRFEELEETNQFLSNQEPGLEDAVDLSDSFEDLSQSEAGSGELVEDEVSNHSFCGEDGCSDVNDSGLPEEFENFDDISQDSCEGIEQIPGADDDLSQNCYEVVELETDEELPDDLEQDIEDKGDKDLSLESYEVVELENNKCGNEFQGNLSDEDLERDPNEGRATIETFGQVLNLDESTADVAEGLTELCNFDLSEFSKMPEVAEESEISAHANSVNVIFCREDNSSDCSFKTCPEDSVASAPSSSSSAVSDKSGEGDSSDEQTQWESFEEEEEEEEEVGEITEETKPASDFVVEDHFGFFDSDDLYRFSQKQSYISCFDGGDVHERLNYEQRETEKQNLRNITQCLEKKLTIDQQEELEELREVQEEFLEAVFEESYETETFEDNIDAKTSQDEAIYQKEEEEDHVDNNSDKTEQEPTHFYQERIKNSLNKHQELSPNADGSQPSDDEAPDRDSDHGFPPCAADISVEGDAYCDSSDVSDLADDLEDGFCVSEDVALLACSEAEPYCLCLHLNPADQEDEEDQEEEDRELEDQNEEEDVKVEDLEEYLEVKDMEEDLEEEDLEEEDLEVVNVEDLELEDLKVEDLELEDLKVEDLELEDLKVEDVKVEDLKVEDLELEDLDQEDLKVEDLEQEDLKVEDREQEVLEVEDLEEEDLEDEVLDVEDLEEEDLEEEVLDGEDLEEEDLEVEEYYVLEMTSIQTSSLQSLRDFLLDVELKMDIRSAFWDKSESLEAELAGRGSQGALLGAPEGAPVGLIHSVPESVKKTESEEDGDSEDEGSDSETEECECEYCVPPTDRALCEPLLPQLQCSEAGKMCVVIDLDETLVHSSFKPLSKADFVIPVEIDGTIHQVYVLKRPHVDLFLQRMGQLFECVLFTASLAKYADPVSDLLDPSGAFRSRLFREDCVFHRGNYVKDLSRLGRDLRRVIIIDNSPFSYAFQPHNAVPVVSWFDDVSDTELLDLIPFFEKLSLEQEVYAALKQQTCSLSS